ncbi:hypothetical protein HYG81_01755 [Natrinema zhouii]|uniref:DUF4145 domain-containing protein n=1 Tax=Natrinema zhouii TaxID=1710539 RepID=A0A7D6CRN1_9EURY|nr:hypothetical protein [Natrinema zhouii]QLK26370.1 hypothetical protein HYG81_01755 [Natrinema zhouii]
MEYDYLLRHFDSGAGQKEQVALIIYYLENDKNKTSINQSDAKTLIQHSRSTVSPSSTSTYFSRLRETGWITPTENEGYRLTHTGEREVEALLDDDALDAPRDESDWFIDSDVFEDNHYQKLVDDINRSYRYRIYDGTMVLTRKMFENLVFEILRGEYAGDDVQMFFDQENQRHYSFDELLNNLKVGVPNLKRFTKEGFNREMVESIRNMKDKGNRSAHSIRVDFDEGEIESISEDATDLAEVLYEVWEGVQNANGE